MKEFFKGSICTITCTITFIMLASVILYCCGGSQYQNTNRSQRQNVNRLQHQNIDGLQNQNMDGQKHQNMDGQKHQNIDGLQNQKTDQSQHDDKLAEDRFAGWDGSGFETGKTTENVDEECTERILECFSRIGENTYDDIPDRLLSSMENVDKMKILWLAARIGPEKRSLIIEIAGEGLSIMNIKSICGILGECLSEDEMEQVATLAEKYTGLILQTE